MFYTMCYASKITQDEDTKAFQTVSNALVRRITRNIMKQRAQTLLCGILSHLGANVCAVPMLYIVVVNDSRCMFSHPFKIYCYHRWKIISVIHTKIFPFKSGLPMIMFQIRN